MQAQDQLTVRLLGPVVVRAADGHDLTPPGKKLRALLTCLALSNGKAWEREKLSALLWSDRDEEQARASLRQALAELRRLLGEPSPLKADRETIGFDPTVAVVDVVEFERLAAAGKMEDAASFYHGDLMDGHIPSDAGFAAWLAIERARLHDLAIDVLTKLANARGGEDAISTVQRMLEIDPQREESHRMLMRLYATGGQRAQALRQYQICREALQRELDVVPEPETELLLKQLQSSDNGTAILAPRDIGHRSGSALGAVAALDSPSPPTRAATGPNARANAERLGRRLAAVVSADVVGYSRHLERDEEDTVQRLKENWRDIVLPAIELHRGRVVKLMGDGALIEFPSVVEAVRFSLEAQQEVEGAESSRSLEERIRYRIGVHLGDVIIDGDDIQGHGVNVSARLQGLADPSGVCISDAVRTALGNTVPLVYEDLGPQEGKNIADPVRAYRIRAAGRVEKTMSVQSQRRQMIAMPLFLGLLTAVAFATVGAYFLYWQPQPPMANSVSGVESEPAEKAVNLETELPSILVTPFANLSEDESQEFFVDGLTEDLIADLSNLSGLFVISRSSAFTLKGQTMRPPQLAEMFGVAYVVNGRMRRAADRVRITVELIEAVNDRQIWAESYDRELIDIFAVQDEVKKRIVQALAVRLRPGEQRLVSMTPTKSVEAYEYYLRGRRAMNSSDFRSMNQAFWAFEKAIALDPDFAEAYASLAMTNALDLTGARGFGGWVRPPHRTRTQATALAQRAASLKPSLAIPEIVFARLSLWDGHYDQAIEHARRAVEHEPGNVDAYTTQAAVLTAAGLHHEAKAAIDEAFRRDPKPSPPTYAVLGMIQYALRDYLAALVTFEMFREKPADADMWMASAFLFAAHGQTGRKVEGQAFALFGAPELSLIQFQRFYRRAEDMEHLLDGLRKVGAPGVPFGFDARNDAGEQLTGQDLKSLLLGSSFDVLCNDWFNRRKSTIRFEGDGSIVWSPREDINDIGKSRIDADKICVTLPLLTRDRDTCFAVYRNGSDPTLEMGRGYAYVMVGPSLCYFSPQQ